MSRLLERDLHSAYPPSPPCNCRVCRGYCGRPGWWTVGEAVRALDAGYGYRMMLEVSTDRLYGVLSPAFKGNEGRIALQEFSGFGCTFLCPGGCQLFGTEIRPLECRFCHHARAGRGQKCHDDLERQWRSVRGQHVVHRWVYDQLQMSGYAEMSV